MTSCSQIIKKIKGAKNIAVFAHRGPDSDACGSMLAFRDLCRLLGKNAEAFCFKYSDYIKNNFDVKEFKSNFSAKNYDLVAFCDMHTAKRLDECYQEEFKKCQNVIIVDHHIISGNEVVASDCARIIPKASASQLVLDLYREIGQKPSKQVANYLYAGLVGDTNRFLNSNLSKEVFEDASYLLECGAEVHKIYDKMYRSISKKEMRLTKYLYGHLKYLQGGKVLYIIFTEKDYKKLDTTFEDIQLFSNTLIQIEGVEWSFLVYQVSKFHFRFSMRSAENIDLVPLASKMKGGGHKNAAAFTKRMKKSQIKKSIEKWTNGVFNANKND